MCASSMHLKVNDFGIGFCERLCVEGRGPEQHLVGADTQCPPVTLRPVSPSALHCPEDLRGQVVWGPHRQRRVDLERGAGLQCSRTS